MHRRRVEHGIALGQTAGPDDFYFKKPAEPATGALGVLFSLSGLGLLTIPALWATFIGIKKKQKFLLVTGIIGLVISIGIVVASFWLFFTSKESFSGFTTEELLPNDKITAKSITGRNGVTTKYPQSMKLTEDSYTTMRFEHITSAFGTVIVDSTEDYEVMRVDTDETIEEVFAALTDVNNLHHHTAWSDYVYRGDSHKVKKHDRATHQLEIEYTETGYSMRSLIALRDAPDGLVVVAYTYEPFGSFNEKQFDDKQWQALLASVTINETKAAE